MLRVSGCSSRELASAKEFIPVTANETHLSLVNSFSLMSQLFPTLTAAHNELFECSSLLLGPNVEQNFPKGKQTSFWNKKIFTDELFHRWLKSGYATLLKLICNQNPLCEAAQSDNSVI